MAGEKGDVIDLIAVFACGGGAPPSRECRTRAFQWARDYLGLSKATPAEIVQRRREAHGKRLEAEAREAAENRRRFDRAFALFLASFVTIIGGTPSTSAAVLVWMSSPRRKASISTGSPDMWASSRSSICE